MLEPGNNLQLAATHKGLLQAPRLLELVLLGEEFSHQGDQPQKTAFHLTGKILLLLVNNNRIFRSGLRRVLNTREAQQRNENKLVCHMRIPRKRAAETAGPLSNRLRDSSWN